MAMELMRERARTSENISRYCECQSRQNNNHIIHYRILAPNYINNFISEPHFLIKQTCNLKPKLIKWFTAIYTIEQFQPFFLYLIPIFKHKHFIRNLSNCVNLLRAHLYCPCGSAFFGEYLFSTFESMQINWLAGTWIS